MVTATNDPAFSRTAAHESFGTDAMATSGATIIVNADDWGRDRENTDRALECMLRGAVSSVSAMVFMEGSERAAALAREHDVDCGLHLNLTASFSTREPSSRLQEHQRKLSSFLRSHRLAPIVYHPFLANSFEYVVRAQLVEFERLYGAPARRFDGHHHMHLCANVQFQKLLPAGTIARRNFSFGPKEKNALNRFYRRCQDRWLAKRHPMTDFFFSLPPMDPPGRMERIFGLARNFSVELETHPVNRNEYEFLTAGELMRLARIAGIARGYSLA
jgi:hypothetical protein